MNGSISGVSCAAAALGAILWCAPAFATTGGRLAYSAPEDCPTRADFEASVAERGGQFDSHDARELRVSIVRDSANFRGTFQTLQAEGASAIREVHGATCREIVAALAVVSAIELRGEDDSASDAPAPVDAPARPSSPPLPLLHESSNAASAPKSEPDEGRLRASSPVGGSRRIEVSAGTLRFDVARSITLFAGGELGILPGTLVPRYDLSLNGASFVTTPDGKSYIAGVIPRFRVSYFGKETYQATGAEVAAQGLGFALALCYSPIYDTGGFVALFCAEYGLGVMQFKSSGTIADPAAIARGTWARTKSSGFQTVGLSFEGEYHLGSVLHLALKLGVDAPLQTLTAERADGSQIFSSSAFLGYGMLGIGLHF